MKPVLATVGPGGVGGDERVGAEGNGEIVPDEGELGAGTDCDPVNVLRTTFLTDDEGRLDLVLSRALGRAQ